MGFAFAMKKCTKAGKIHVFIIYRKEREKNVYVVEVRAGSVICCICDILTSKRSSSGVFLIFCINVKKLKKTIDTEGESMYNKYHPARNGHHQEPENKKPEKT